jgi:hypothetical protein
VKSVLSALSLRFTSALGGFQHIPLSARFGEKYSTYGKSFIFYRGLGLSLSVAESCAEAHPLELDLALVHPLSHLPASGHLQLALVV